MNGVNYDLAAGFASTACPDAACAADLDDFEGALRAMLRLGAIDEGTARRLRQADATEKAAAAAEILRFRSVTIEIVEALRAGIPVERRLLDAVNRRLAQGGWSREVYRENGSYAARTTFAIERPAHLLLPLAYAVLETLTAVDPARLKQCRGERCTCYFVDTSKNRTRTWCSMARCGNRVKVAAYYTRQQASREESKQAG